MRGYEACAAPKPPTRQLHRAPEGYELPTRCVSREDEPICPRCRLRLAVLTLDVMKANGNTALRANEMCVQV
jgi:hypothetical protein